MDAEEELHEGARRVSTGQGRPRPYWMVGLGFLTLLLVVFFGAFLADRQLRPAVGVEPAPTAAPKAGTQVPVAGGSIPSSQPTSTLSVLAVPTGTTRAAIIPATPTAEPQLAREIEDAYVRYWEVRTRAYFDLDTSRLPEVMAGNELARAEKQITELKAQGRAGKLDVEHGIILVKVSPTEATIYDEYLNRSVFLDASTKQEIPTKEPPTVERISFLMKKIDGIWKVVDGTQHN